MKEQYRLISIIRNIEPEYICDIAETLIDAGILCMEVSLSEPEKSFQCLEKLRKQYGTGKFLLGAGTVSTAEEVDRLKALDIPFFVTPGFDEPLVDYALGEGLDVVPGVFTPSDVQKAKNRGLSLVKMFPAGAMPASYIKDIKGPFPRMNFLAVGGVNIHNIPKFFAAGYVGAGIGSAIVPQQATSANLDSISAAAKAHVQAVRKATAKA